MRLEMRIVAAMIGFQCGNQIGHVRWPAGRGYSGRLRHARLWIAGGSVQSLEPVEEREGPLFHERFDVLRGQGVSESRVGKNEAQDILIHAGIPDSQAMLGVLIPRLTRVG